MANSPMPSPSSASAPTLTELFHALQQDGRVGSRHISTYLALLQCRERHLRALVQRNATANTSAPITPAPQPVSPVAQTRPFYIHRDEIMRLAKIQGRNTYYRIMSELDAWGYIEYWPSRRSKGASKVFLPLRLV